MVPVAISVTSSGTFRSVQYHGEVFKSFFGIHIFQFGKHGPVQQAGTDYKDGTVRPFFDDLRVGQDVDRGTVYEDIIIFRSQCRYQRSQFAAFQQFRWVGRYCPDG